MTDESPEDMIGYEAILKEALRGAIPAILKKFLPSAPGEHHLYITFRTDRLDVNLPDWLKAQYPAEMTVVLQHRFWDLEVGETSMAVKMQFSGVLAPMLIGYGAITRIYDPAAQVLLQYDELDAEIARRPQHTPLDIGKTAAEVVHDAMFGPDDVGPAPADTVVSLDQFRKKT